MRLEFTLSDEPDYMLVSCHGDYDRPSMESMFAQVLAAGADRKQPKVLFDFRSMTGNVPLSDKYFITDGLSQLCARYLPHLEFRLVCLGTEKQISQERFVETVFRNRGGTGLVTTDPTEADDWLRAQIDKPGGST